MQETQRLGWRECTDYTISNRRRKRKRIFTLFTILFAINVSAIIICCRYLNFKTGKNVGSIKYPDKTAEKETLLHLTRKRVDIEMHDYNYEDSDVKNLEDLLIEHRGKPVRSIIVSSWRSGSTFLGGLLNAIPSTFYTYEPLMKYRSRQIRGPPLAENSTNVIRQILKCNFEGLEEFYFDFAKKIKHNVDMVRINERLWDVCSYKEDELCYSPDFVSKMCKLYPFQAMKTVRYRLPAAKDILDDKDLNARVLLLVRDPRPVLKSRSDNFCRSKDCIDSQTVCADMLKDYEAAVTFSRIYPDRFMALRYEDLIINLNTTVDQVLKFLRLSRTPSIDRFLESHTNTDDTEKFSTYRVSKDVPLKWRRVMSFDEVEKIQVSCQEAMNKWGYIPANNASHLTSDEFYPLQSYFLYK